jgi:O-antigen ligase
MAVGAAVNRRGPVERWFALPVALLAPLFGVAAVVSPVAAVAGAAALLFVAVAFYDLAAGVALFATLTFLETLPGAGGGLGAVKVAGFVLVLAALRRSGAPFLLKECPALAYVATFFAGWAVASSLWAEDVARAGGEGLRLVLNVALVFVVFAAVRDARDARWIVWGYLAGGAAAAVVGFLDPLEDGSNRLSGGLGEPNFLAAVLIPALVLALFALGWTARATAQRWLLWGSVLLFTVAIFLTQSRGGLVALAVTLVAALLFGGRMRRHFAVLGAVAAAVGLVYYGAFASSEALERLASPGRGTGRADLWSVATGVIADHPFVGVGAGNFPIIAPQYASAPVNLPSAYLVVDTPKVAHNTYLGVFADLGIVGLLAFVVIVLSALDLARRATKYFARSGEVELELLCRAVLVGLVGMLAAFVFLSGEYEKQLWLLIGLAVALYGLARRRLQRTPAPARTAQRLHPR